MPYVLHGDAFEDGECKCTGLDISRYSKPGDALLYLSPGSNVRRVPVRARPSSSADRRIAPVCVHVRNMKVLACSLFFRSVPSARDAEVPGDRSQSPDIVPISRSTRYCAGYRALIPTIPIFFKRRKISSEDIRRDSENDHQSKLIITFLYKSSSCVIASKRGIILIFRLCRDALK